MPAESSVQLEGEVLNASSTNVVGAPHNDHTTPELVTMWPAKQRCDRFAMAYRAAAAPGGNPQPSGDFGQSPVMGFRRPAESTNFDPTQGQGPTLPSASHQNPRNKKPALEPKDLGVTTLHQLPSSTTTSPPQGG